MGNPFRRFRLRKFKRRKLRAERTKKARTYKIHFSFLLKDKDKNHKIENLSIEIPAKSAFDAKSKLKVFLKSKVGYEVHDIEVVDNPNDKTKS